MLFMMLPSMVGVFLSKFLWQFSRGHVGPNTEVCFCHFNICWLDIRANGQGIPKENNRQTKTQVGKCLLGTRNGHSVWQSGQVLGLSTNSWQNCRIPAAERSGQHVERSLLWWAISKLACCLLGVGVKPKELWSKLGIGPKYCKAPKVLLAKPENWHGALSL